MRNILHIFPSQMECRFVRLPPSFPSCCPRESRGFRMRYLPFERTRWYTRRCVIIVIRVHIFVSDRTSRLFGGKIRKMEVSRMKNNTRYTVVHFFSRFVSPKIIINSCSKTRVVLRYTIPERNLQTLRQHRFFGPYVVYVCQRVSLLHHR